MEPLEITKPGKQKEQGAPGIPNTLWLFNACPGHDLELVFPTDSTEVAGTFYRNLRICAENAWTSLSASQRPGHLVIEASSSYVRGAVHGEVADDIQRELSRRISAAILRQPNAGEPFSCGDQDGERHFRVFFKPALFWQLEAGVSKENDAGDGQGLPAGKAIETPLPVEINNLIANLNHDDLTIRRAAIDALKDKGADAVPALIEALAKRDWLIRHNAVLALGQLGSPMRALEALLGALRDQNVCVRWCAAWALGEAGPNAKATVAAALTHALHDSVKTVRTEAAAALTRIGADSGDVPQLDLAEQSATLLVNKATRLGLAGFTDEKMAICDKVVQRYGRREEAGIAAQVARALVSKGILFDDAGQYEKALAVYDQVVECYGNRQEAGIAEQVGNALFNKGITLGKAGDSTESLAVYEDLVQRYRGRAEAEIARLVAMALINKAVAFADAGHAKEALAVYKELVRWCYGKRQEAGIAAPVATALVNKGILLFEAGHTEEAIAVCNEVARRYSAYEEVEIAEEVATALVNKAFMLRYTGDTKEAIAACNEVARRYGKYEEPGLVVQVARALFDKALALGADGDTKKELAVYEELVQLYGDREEAGIAELVGKALINTGITLGKDGSAAEAVAPLTQALHKGSSAIRAAAAQALTELGAPAVPALIAWATISGLSKIEQQQAMDIIKAMGTAAVPALLDMVRDVNRPEDQRWQALNLLNAADLDPESAVPLLIHLFTAPEGTGLPMLAARLLAAIGLPSIPLLVTGLDEQHESIVFWAALTLTKLAGTPKAPPTPDIQKALEQAVPRLTDLLANALRKHTQEQHDAVDAPPFLPPLKAITEFSRKADAAIVGLKEMLARRERMWQPDMKEWLQRLEHRLREQNPDFQLKLEKDLKDAREKLDEFVEKLGDERRKQAARLSPILNKYLLLWAEHERSVNEADSARPVEAIAGAKHELAERVSGQLSRLHFAIDFNSQPTDLMAHTNKFSRRGYFLLMPKGAKKPVLTRTDLSDLLAVAGGPNRNPGFDLVEAPLRREALSEWRERVKAHAANNQAPLQNR
jgi:tetratricopeptide (TPR) repeat protein